MLGEMSWDCSAALACSLLESSSELCWQAVSSGVSRALPQAPLALNCDV